MIFRPFPLPLPLCLDYMHVLVWRARCSRHKIPRWQSYTATAGAVCSRALCALQDSRYVLFFIPHKNWIILKVGRDVVWWYGKQVRVQPTLLEAIPKTALLALHALCSVRYKTRFVKNLDVIKECQDCLTWSKMMASLIQAVFGFLQTKRVLFAKMGYYTDPPHPSKGYTPNNALYEYLHIFCFQFQVE